MVKARLRRRNYSGIRRLSQRKVSLGELTPSQELDLCLMSEQEIGEILMKNNLPNEISSAIRSVINLARDGNRQVAETRRIFAQHGAFAYRYCSEQQRRKLARANALNDVARVLAAATGLPESSFNIAL
jgi:hypothetical protein